MDLSQISKIPIIRDENEGTVWSFMISTSVGSRGLSASRHWSANASQSYTFLLYVSVAVILSGSSSDVVHPIKKAGMKENRRG